MTDLKTLAYELMHEAQQSLQDDGHLTPTVVVITPHENLIFEMDYESEEERSELYSAMVEAATEQSALAILTVDDAYIDAAAGPVKLEGPGWGKLSAAPAETIIIVVSGGGFETWTLTCPYVRNENQFAFQPNTEKADPGAEMELLGDWTGKTGVA